MLEPIERYKIIREEYRKGDHVLLWVTILPHINWYARLKKGTLGRKDFAISIQIQTYMYDYNTNKGYEYIIKTKPEIEEFHLKEFKTEEEARSFCQEEYLKFISNILNE